MSQPKHWAQIEEISFIWGMRFLLRIYLLFGRTILQIFLYPVVMYYWLLNRPARHASRYYLRRLADFAPDLTLQAGWYGSFRHFISFANAIIDKLAAWSGAISPEDVVFHGRETLMAEINQGHGAVLLGSHLGNLEVCRIIADFDQDFRANVLVHTKHAEKFNRLLNKCARNQNLELIQVTEITAATAQLLNEKIEAGELVIMAADRTPVSTQNRVSKAKFLGALAEFPQGPFILAALLKCPVYTLFCLKQDNKHVIYFERFSGCLEIPRRSRAQALQKVIQDYARRLETFCLKAPLQWFNFFDFWRDSAIAGDE